MSNVRAGGRETSMLVTAVSFLHNYSHDAVHYIPAAVAAATSLQSCLTLCDPIDGSPPGSPVPGILQERTLGLIIL